MSLNKVMLIGNLTRDAEIRQVGQSQVAAFGVATSEAYTDQQGQRKEITEFHNVEYFSNNGGVFQYLKKGQQVYVEGSIKTDKWTDQNGQEKQAVKVRARSIQLLGKKDQSAQPQGQMPALGQGVIYPPQGQQQTPPQGYPPQGYQQAPPQQGGYPPQGQQMPQGGYPPQQGYQPPMPQSQPGYQMPFPQGGDEF